MTKQTRICEVCGKEFTPRNSLQKLCGDSECRKAKRRQYTKGHKGIAQSKVEYRKQEHVKKAMAEYDKKYQQEHKEQIRAYKKFWFAKRQFLKYVEKKTILKNAYWFSLSETEKKQILDKIR